MKRTEGERHAPQGRARTMSDGQEALIRQVIAASVAAAETGGTLYANPLLAELDAERAAHAETKECLRRVRAFTRHHNWCECLSPSAFENGGDYSNNPPCNCGATEGFEMFERLFPDHDHGDETQRTLAWRHAMTALKARLALAEAVCESCRQQDRGYGQEYATQALAAWRAAK